MIAQLITNTLISTAHAAATSAADANASPIPSILMMVVFMGLLYFVMIRPQQKRQQDQLDLIKSLEVGDEVLLNGGLTGKIEQLDESFIHLKIAPEVIVKAQKSAVIKSYPKGTL